MTKYLAVRFAELGEALSDLSKAVAALGERLNSSLEPAPPKDDGKVAAAEFEKRVRAFAADFHRWRELQRNDNRRLFVAGGSAAAICLLLLGLLIQAQTGIRRGATRRTGGRITSGRSTDLRSSSANSSFARTCRRRSARSSL